MQAILTKFLPPTNCRPARILAIHSPHSSKTPASMDPEAVNILHRVWVAPTGLLSRAEADYLIRQRLGEESALETCLRLSGYTEDERKELRSLAYSAWRAQFARIQTKRLEAGRMADLAS